MRPQQNRRIRGRNNGNNNHRRGPNPLSRNYESNGPDVKIRGHAQQIADKYISLARDAHACGDRVMAENYLQHAEHYTRIILLAQSQMANTAMRDEAFDDGGDDVLSSDEFSSAENMQPGSSDVVMETSEALDAAALELGQPSHLEDERAEVRNRAEKVTRRNVRPRPPRQPKAECLNPSEHMVGAIGSDLATAFPLSVPILDDESEHKNGEMSTEVLHPEAVGVAEAGNLEEKKPRRRRLRSTKAEASL
ncbi:DUF4167 domain-containing protein [Bartonella sp. DGB2]|uniref:DUF4167 domain-containing protein n=1 Tax=Bartonella sp. DGB2 TaxID=3388426 RepID=UPI0039902FD7